MTDDLNNKKPNPGGAIQPTGTGTGIKILGGSKKAPLWARDKQAATLQQKRADTNRQVAAERENRIALLLDISGSMAGDKIEQLRIACTKFLDSTDLSTTSLAIETFPYSQYSRSDDSEAVDDISGSEGIRLGLTCDFGILTLAIMGLRSMGSTPMHRALAHVHSNLPITRGVLISDGEADSPSDAIEQAKGYKESSTPIDCIHIGMDRGGEATLKEIAELTGGIFIKFTDVDVFAKALIYLTPRHRAMLTSGQVSAKQIGASEVKYLGGSK